MNTAASDTPSTLPATPLLPPLDRPEPLAERLNPNGQIVLTWLTRLRWLAIAGQIIAIAAAALFLQTHPPLIPLSCVILVAALTNAWLSLHHAPAPSPRLIPAIIILDVFLLTALLYLTGGPDNPFSALYLIHVAMAAAVMAPTSTFLVAATSAICYALLFKWHQPLSSYRPVPAYVTDAGNWTALALVAALIAYFIGRVTLALRHREQELSHVRERATRAEQLAALTTLAAGAAHELGTPLATIAVVAKELELASTHPNAAASEISEDARLIRREVDRCRSILIRMRVDILEDSPTRPTPVKAHELLAHLKAQLNESEQPRLSPRISPDAENLIIPLRAVQQALGVLLRNAFDASPQNAPVQLQITRTDKFIQFQITDQGPGMPTHILRRAGEPFFTTKPPGQGMGLGLFLVRLVAERWSGNFHLTSTPPQGAQSTLQLPLIP